MILEITNLKNKLKNSIFWLSGNFNLPVVHWPNQAVTGTMYPREFNGLFIDMINKLGIDQLVDFPTRKDNIFDPFLYKSTIVTK
jgi:hypothetical protein